MTLIGTSFVYGTGGGRSASEIVFRDLAPMVGAGLVAAFFLSRWSPLAPKYRSQGALFLSASLAMVSGGIPRLGLLSEAYFSGAASAFGLAFAISRIRTVAPQRSIAGWICAVVHSLLILEAFQSLHL